MNQIVFEIFSEEIPPNMQLDALQTISSNILESIKRCFPNYSNLPFIENFVTPRRISFYIGNFEYLDNNKKESNVEEIRGPKINAPESAINGFMNKYNVNDIKDLNVKNGTYFFQKHVILGDVKSIIQKIFKESVESYTWPQSMRWGSYNFKWIRPIHNILAMFNDEIMPLEIAHLKANNKTFGHRKMFGDEITLNHANEYKERMLNSGVILDFEERKEIIKNEANKLAKSLNLFILNDEELFEEITGLVEQPVILLGRISTHFMSLPDEVLVTTLKNNQKYIMLLDEKNEIAPYYIIVSNLNAKDGNKSIIQGNEKVLNARLSDAMYFFELDKKENFANRYDKLKNIFFHRDIGTVYDKVERIRKILTDLSEDSGLNCDLLDKAALLMKNDLTTEMVSEFPELQGIIGSYYALDEKNDIEVVRAIRDHYKPQGPYDNIPMNKIGGVLAIADKIETLQSMFEVGIKPTGSKDPYALRRAALGIIRIIDAYKLILPFSRYGISSEVIDFIYERLENLEGFNNDSEKLDFIKQSLKY